MSRQNNWPKAAKTIKQPKENKLQVWSSQKALLTSCWWSIFPGQWTKLWWIESCTWQNGVFANTESHLTWHRELTLGSLTNARSNINCLQTHSIKMKDEKKKKHTSQTYPHFLKWVPGMTSLNNIWNMYLSPFVLQLPKCIEATQEARRPLQCKNHTKAAPQPGVCLSRC